MQWKEGKKKLAVLLSAALVLSLVPTSAFTALAEAWSGTWEQGTPWLKDVKMTPLNTEIEVGQTTTITVEATKVASPSGADPAVGTPSTAQEVLNLLKYGNVSVSEGGYVAVKKVENGVITVEGEAEGKAKITLEGIDGSSCYCEITVKDPIKAAKAAIQEAFSTPSPYEVNQAEADQKEKLESFLKGKADAVLSEKDITDVTVTVTVSITKPVKAETSDMGNGEDGIFTFDVKVGKGDRSDSIASLSGKIKHTPYSGGKTNYDVANNAKTAIEEAALSGKYTVNQTQANTSGTVKTFLDGKVEEVLRSVEIANDSITVQAITVKEEDFVAATEGTADEPDGKPGSFTFRVTIKVGTRTAETSDVKGTINQKTYDGTSNQTLAEEAAEAAKNGEYEIEQTKANTTKGLQAVLVDKVKEVLNGAGKTTASVTSITVNSEGFEPAKAGTADDPEGEPGSFTFSVTITVGKHTATAENIQGTITPTPFIITGFTFNPNPVTINLSETLNAEVVVSPQLSGELTEEQKKAVVQDYYDGKFMVEFGFSGKNCAQLLQMKINEEDLTVSLTIEGLAKDSATLTFSYGAITASCDVHVTETGDDPIVKAESPQIDMGGMNAEELKGTLSSDPEQGTSVPDNASKQIETILSTLNRSNLPFEANNESVEAALQEANPRAGVIVLTPIIQVQGLDLGVEDDKVIVKSMDAELTVDIEVDGKPLTDEETKTILKNNNIYISMSVAVPERAARGGADYVQWTHYADDARTATDNSVLEDEVTRISTDNIATVRARSFSPFKLEFVMSDNESAYSSDSDSGSSVVLVGQWLRAEDGVRWWYRYPDGTWPAGGWAELVWNGKLDWYYFDEKGYMVTGWVTDGGLRYYLHPISDGTQGYMYTGWHLIDGKYYYFSNISDGTRGHLLVNTTTPDGAVVGADGARIQ